MKTIILTLGIAMAIYLGCLFMGGKAVVKAVDQRVKQTEQLLNEP